MSLAAYISRRVVFADDIRPAAVIVDTESGEIVRIAEADSPGQADQRHDLGDHALLPGLIDPHVHINEPGRTEWEGFATATRAAAAGGLTTLVDMPLNCLPETTTVAALEAKRAAAAGKCIVDWRSWGGAEGSPEKDGNQAHLLPLATAGAAGFKCFLVYPGCDGLGLLDEPSLRAAMPIIAKSGLPLLVHAELPGPIEAAAALTGADWSSYATYLASRPDESELAAIRLLIDLCREFGTRIHIVHLATALALPMLRAAKAEGLPITLETCPHYLHFAAEEIADGATLLKCAPPIRSKENQRGLWRGLHDRTIDMVVTDHSPCPPEMKRADTGRFDQAWGGIASLSLALSIIHTDSTRRGDTLDDIARWMSSAPAALAGIAHNAGALQPNRDASFIIFDTEAEFTVTPDKLHYRHTVSPYLGETLRGAVKATYLRGEPVYQQGVFAPSPSGREVKL